MAGNYNEKRKAARLDIPIRVEYSCLASKVRGHAALTKNISAGGCLLVTEEELPVDSRVELNIYLGDESLEAVKLEGVVVRSCGSGGRFEHGISFAGMDQAAKKRFADFCFAKMYEMIGLSKWPTAKKS